MKTSTMKTKVNSDYVHRYTHLTVTEQFRVSGVMPARLVCFGREKTTTMISQHLPDEAAREQFTRDFRLLCVAEGALAAACMVEIWLCPPDGANCRPSLHPDRQEFVLVNIELLDGEGATKLYPIIRTGDAKPTLGQAHIIPRQSKPGELMGFLPAEPPTEAERLVAASLLYRTGRELHQFPLPKI
jgi:hypothetical protein